MDTKESTCKERIQGECENTEKALAEIVARYNGNDFGTEENRGAQFDQAYEDLYSFALSVDTKKLTTILLSWGGPSDYLEVIHEGEEIYRLTYHFADWFDHAEITITDEDSPLYEYAQHIIEAQEMRGE